MVDQTRNQSIKVGGHIPALDGIRGIAILLVMLYHFTVYSGMNRIATPDWLFHRVASAGWIGVDLFFVLSGFLITGILLDTRGGPHFFRNFYARRFLRIFPLYYASLALAFFLLPRLGPAGQDFDSLLSEQGWYWTYLLNARIALDGWPDPYYLGHFWSLAVEEQFYLVWPAVVFLLGRRRLVVASVLLVVAGLGIRVALQATDLPVTASYALTFARMDTLAVGALIAVLLRQRKGLLLLSRFAWPVGSASAAALMAPLLLERRLIYTDPAVQTAGYTGLALFFGALLVVAVISREGTVLGRFFTGAWLRFFGRYSYGLYVGHGVVVLLMRDFGFSARMVPEFMGSQLPGLAAFSTLALALSLALAAFSWHLYESQILKLKSHFPYHRTAASVDSATKQETQHAA